jgi:hypothetical protein
MFMIFFDVKILQLLHNVDVTTENYRGLCETTGQQNVDVTTENYRGLGKTAGQQSEI